MKKAAVAAGSPFMSDVSTAFNILNMPVSMILDRQKLDHHYYQAQLLVNPDQFVGKTDFEKRIAADHALVITQAYQCLKDPICRAQELLKAKGMTIPGDHGQTVNCPELLQEIMHWQEEIETCRDDEQRNLLQQSIKNNLDQQTQKFDQDVCPENYLRFIYLTKIHQSF